MFLRISKISENLSVSEKFSWSKALMMESTSVLNETATESSADDAVVHVKRKETESSAAEAPELVEQPSSSALEQPASLETLVEALAGSDIELDPGSGSEPAVAVEELTVDNYKGPSLFGGVSSSSSGGEGSMAKKGLWSNLTRLSGPSGLPNYSKFSDYLAESENRSHGRPVEGIWTKVLPASGFPQFVVRSALKGHGVKHALRGKGLVNRHRVSFKEPRAVSKNQNNAIKQLDNVGADSSSLGGPNERAAGEVLVGAGNCVVSNIGSDGISLREWLTPRSRKLNNSERLHLFKQVLEIVDSSHLQGLVLQNLRPSCFFIMPSNLVKYVGSFIPQMEHSMCPADQDIGYLEHHSKRRRYFEYGDEEQGNLSLMYRRHDKSYTSTRMQGYPTVFGAGWRHSIAELQKLEERWYASPEELQENICSSSSNIYSLGVLFFELFCCFETWEVHSTAMSDLRHRILPPSFLSESPKEASFCLWLLHPDPSSRPHSRDILQSDLICKDRNFTSLDQLLASIEEEDAEADLLLHFLLNLKEQKEKQAAKLGADVECLKADIEEVERRYTSRSEFLSDACGLQTNFKDISDNYPLKRPINMEGASRFSDSNVNDGRFMKNIDQLENVYFSLRSKVDEVKLPERSTVARFDTDVLEIRDKYSQAQNGDHTWTKTTDPLGTFFEGLCKYARYSKFEVCGSLRSVDIVNSANVICSLSFDRDEDYVAAAGVSKKIKIYEFDALLKDSVDVHYPLTEMSSRSKLTCVCWNNYIKNYLASTDYGGMVQLWDASTGQGFAQYAEHQKRAWSVDFSLVDPTKLASGSDDCSVKLWSINERKCIDTIRNLANVCCVQFSTQSSHLLAFGSADYKIYCFDLRHTKNPWCTLAGHGKSVSYVKFVDSDTVVSVSTDNTIKLWELKKTSPSGLSTNACSLTLSGHTNEKNFVGLSVSDGYIACGSETNEVYAYYRTLPMPITCHKFGSIDPSTGHETGDDNGQFVSSVCWRSKSDMVVAANSSGSIEVLRMV